jgi:hypothetical protein
MQYRITYLDRAHGATVAETIIVSGIRAVHALIDYANKWDDQILSVEERASRTRAWKSTSISQQD